MFTPARLLLALSLAVIGVLDDPTPLVNPSFEADPVLAGWDLITYGAPADAAGEPAGAVHGLQALRLSSSEPSDTALGQEVSLTGDRWYRFTGRVRTAGLTAVDAPVLGTYQVHLPGGAGVLASGPSHAGDTVWTEVPLVFRAPPDGRVRIAAFLAGYGKGRGTAWFDGLKLAPIDPTASPVVITHEPLVPGRIDPRQYGQFVEYLCDLVPSMWADTLDDGDFEGLSPYAFAYLKETDFRAHPWYPTGATNRATFERDPTTKVNGSTSFRIAATDGPPCTVGIAQDGIAVRQGVACDWSVHLKAEGVRGPVRVRLHREGTEYASAELHPTADWSKQTARLVPVGTDDRATLTIEFTGPGTLRLDAARLMPQDAVGGWRADVVAAVRAQKPAVIRFGGSAVDEPSFGDFDWRWTIGDPDRRAPFRAWGGLQPTGPGLEEFVNFCRLVDAEPLICVRVTGREPAEAAAQVEYFNGAPDSPMGALRARNGHPEPYGVRLWQVGNERGGPEYEARLAAFCAAMKAADPSIELLSSFPTPAIVERAGSLLDHVAPHHYGCANLAAMEADLTNIRRMIAAHGGGRPIRVAVTEWNTTAGDWGPPRAGLWTLANGLAVARYHNLLHRNADLVAIANRSNLINSFCSGYLQADDRRLYGTPAYHVQSLYANHAGSRPLRIASDIPPEAGPDFTATLTDDGAAVVLLAVNDGLSPITRPLDFGDFGRAGQTVEVETIADAHQAGEPDATNSFAEPERIAARPSTFRAEGARFDYTFSPLSVTLLRWKVEAGAGR